MSKGVSSASPCEPVTCLVQPRRPGASRPATTQHQVSSCRCRPRDNGQPPNPLPSRAAPAHPSQPPPPQLGCPQVKRVAEGHWGSRALPFSPPGRWVEGGSRALLAGNDGCGGETCGGEVVSGASSPRRAPSRARGAGEHQIWSKQSSAVPRGGCSSSPAPSSHACDPSQVLGRGLTLTCCIGQVVLRRQQRVPEVVVVVMRREQALGRRGAGPVGAPLCPTSSPDAATAPATSHHTAAAAVPLLRRLLTYLEKRKQMHAEGHYQLPWGAGQHPIHAGSSRLPHRDEVSPAFPKGSPRCCWEMTGWPVTSPKVAGRMQVLSEGSSFLMVTKLHLPAWPRRSS